MESLPSPFGDPAPNLSDSELRETAYEILVADCRSTGSRPLTYIPQSNRSNAGATAGLSPSPSLHRSLTSTAASKVKKALGMKKKNGGEESSSQSDRGKKFATVGELIRIQMRISEQIDSRIRRALLRIASGQLGRHPEKMVLPLELLQQLKATDFPDQEEYVSWQRRNLKLLEAGLILYPCVSLSKSDKSVQQLKQIIRSGLEKPLDTGKITGETQNLRSLVMSLASAAEEATAVFGETAALSIQKQYMQQLSTSLGLNTYNEERNATSTKNTGSEDYIARGSLKIHKAMALQISLEISILMVLMVVFQICHFILRLLQWLHRFLLRTLGEGCRHSYMYRCQEALDTYMKLPHKHYNTGWVLSQVGKAYFELIDYLEAEKSFRLARQASPYSLEGMDIYSTVLYHLKEDMKLSYLAQELISTDRLAPQSWCAMGNCYSLQKDHETALKNFLRAVQLNPRFAYAHTLCGHEYTTLEDFENGMKSYQNALRVDTRHYNAWYGLGMIYLRQEKLEFSEHHFRMAFLINPSSSVIMSYLGTALHALKRSEEALEIMEHAIVADRKNPLPMYQKANILVCLERLDEALEVLEELKEYAPSESSVYALMGRIYKRRNMHDKAMLHFGLALDMKPPATDVAAIKAAMEKLHVPDEIDESP